MGIALFHRVIPGFMVQTGGYRSDLTLLPESDELRNEADNGLTNQRGTLAMARMDAIDSATRQFFINVADNPHLDHQQASCTRREEEERVAAAERGLLKPRTCASFGYVVFGRVVAGMDVVDDIADQDTDITDFPEPILMTNSDQVEAHLLNGQLHCLLDSPALAKVTCSLRRALFEASVVCGAHCGRSEAQPPRWQF